MTDASIFIFGCAVYAMVIAASLVGMIGTSDNHELDEDPLQPNDKSVHTKLTNRS